MNTHSFFIGTIPALLWGPPTGRIFVAAHGVASSKSDAPIALLADVAVPLGYQILSFDLPAHGARTTDGSTFTIEACTADFAAVLQYAKAQTPRLSLFGCSAGAFCGLLAGQQLAFEQCLLLSPVLDMRLLTEGMMTAAGVTKTQLQQQKIIPLDGGPVLYWHDYCYLCAHPVQNWQSPTAILRGELDTLCTQPDAARFAAAHHCSLTMVPGAEHYFHTDAQLAAYRGWLQQTMTTG